VNQQFLRNAIHAATGVTAIWVISVPQPLALWGLTAVLGMAVLLDIWRWRGGQPTLDKLLPGVYRHPEPLWLSGATLLLGGYILAFVLFPPRAAAAGILALALGDPAAAMAGRWYGRRSERQERPAKTWVGSLACFAACIPPIWLLPGFGLPAAAAGGAMAALVERRSGPLDNVLIPVSVAMLLNLWMP